MISDEGDFGLGDLHQTLQDGERVVIRPARPEDRALYLDFLHDVSAEDLCDFGFLGVLLSSALRRSISSPISTTGMKWLSSHSTKTRVRCLGSYA